VRIGPFEPGHCAGDGDALVLVVLGGECVMRRDAHRRQKQRGRRNAKGLAHFRSGAWVFRGTRVPVSAIFENLKTSPIEEVLENFHVTREQVQTVLDFAAKSTQPLETLRVG
jgi:uncharacterized protein (DUF433 family)